MKAHDQAEHTAWMVAFFKELAALERAAAVIASRDDLAENFTWQAVATAIAERRARLIAAADRALSEPVSLRNETSKAPALTYCGPPGRVH